MHAYIISDLHLGSSATRYNTFMAFVERMPEGVALILNGDIVNAATKSQSRRTESAAVQHTLAAASFHRPVIWLGGNNDTDYQPATPGQISFRASFAIGRRLYVCHGHQFLALPSGAGLVRQMVAWYCRRLQLRSARTLHMSDVIRHIPPLYRLACLLVASRAIRFARRNGYAAIACGHTHCPDVRPSGHVAYFNTGAWMAGTPHYLEVTDADVRLRKVAEHAPARGGRTD